jgi:hypothetical protein
MNSDQELARAIALEKFKFDRSRELEDYKAIEARHQISFKATLDFGTMACRSALLINGAGAIALMTFIGHQGEMIAPLSRALACFALGSGLAVLAMAATYLAQAFFTPNGVNGSPLQRTGYVFQGLAILSFIGSAVLFFRGLIVARTSFNPGFTVFP